LAGKREHDSEDGEDKGQDEEKCCGGNGSMMTMGGTFGAVRMTLSVTITMRR
jgi:hypothetical protein